MVSFSGSQLALIILITFHQRCASDAAIPKKHGSRHHQRRPDVGTSQVSPDVHGMRHSTSDEGSSVDVPATSDEGSSVDVPATSDEGSSVDVPATSDEGSSVDVPATSDERSSVVVPAKEKQRNRKMPTRGTMEDRMQERQLLSKTVLIAVIVACVIVVVAVVVGVVLCGLYVCGWSPRFQQWVYNRRRRWQQHQTVEPHGDVYDYIEETEHLTSPRVSSAASQSVLGSRVAPADVYVEVSDSSGPDPASSNLRPDVEYSNRNNNRIIFQQLPAPGATHSPYSPYSTADSGIQIIPMATPPDLAGEVEESCVTIPFPGQELATRLDPTPSHQSEHAENVSQQTGGEAITSDDTSRNSQPCRDGQHCTSQDRPDGTTITDQGQYAHLGQTSKPPALTNVYDG